MLHGIKLNIMVHNITDKDAIIIKLFLRWISQLMVNNVLSVRRETNVKDQELKNQTSQNQNTDSRNYLGNEVNNYYYIKC